MRTLLIITLSALFAFVSVVISRDGTDPGNPVRQTQMTFMEISLSFFNDTPSSDGAISYLTALLDRGCDSLEDLRRRQPKPDSSAALREDPLQKLRTASGRLRNVLDLHIPLDSARTLVREAYYAFLNLYRDDLLREALTSGNRKLLLFSASVTCDCTRKLCDAYIADIAWVQNEIDDFPEVVIIDCTEEPLLMKEYSIDTIPTVIILDEHNREITRIQGEERIISILAETLRAKRDKE